MDRRIFVDRILETENLTDELEDKEAKWLLDWSISHLDLVLKKVAKPQLAGDKVNAYMAVIRKINRMIGPRQDRSIESLSSDLDSLAVMYAGVINGKYKPSPGECAALAEKIKTADGIQALEYLCQWLNPPHIA